MKKTNILTLMLVLTVSVAFGQYNLNYPDIKIGNSPTGKIVLNGSNLQMPRIGLGSSTDSILTILGGVVKKVPRSSVVSPIPNLQQVLTAGYISNQPIEVAAIAAGSGSIVNQPSQPTHILRLDDVSSGKTIGANTTGSADKWAGKGIAYPSELQQGDIIFYNGSNFSTTAFPGELATNKVTTLSSPNNTTYPTTLAVSNSLANYMDLTTNQTAAGNKTFTNNVATGGTLMVGSATGNNMFFDNSGSGYMSFSARNNGGSQGMNWNAAEFFFNGKMSFPSGVLEYPSFGSGNFVFNNARTAGSMLFQNNGVNRMEITSSTTNVTGDMGVKGNFSTFPLTGTYPYLTMSTAGIFSAIGSATNRININASNQVISFQQGAILGGVSSSTLTANRSWTLPDQAGTFAMKADFATGQTIGARATGTTLNDATTAGNNSNTAIRVAGGSNLTGGPALEMYYDTGVATPTASITSYDRTGAMFKPLTIQSQYTNFATGSVGIGTTNTTSRLTVNGDIEITDSTKGAILTAPNGSRWRITVSNTGVLSTTSIP